MLIDITKYNFSPKGVMQIGVHHAQEHATFVKMGIPHFVYVEPAKEAFAVLETKFAGVKNVTLINAACGSRVGRAVLNVETSNQGQSNSLLKMGTHLRQHPEIVFNSEQEVDVLTIDWIKPGICDFLVMDCQGAEMEILQGATESLQYFDWVYTEVNQKDVYLGCGTIQDIDLLLSDFTRVETVWCGVWGDAFYVRKKWGV